MREEKLTSHSKHYHRYDSLEPFILEELVLKHGRLSLNPVRRPTLPKVIPDLLLEPFRFLARFG